MHKSIICIGKIYKKLGSMSKENYKFERSTKEQDLSHVKLRSDQYVEHFSKSLIGGGPGD